jgi:hypothetical protein
MLSEGFSQKNILKHTVKQMIIMGFVQIYYQYD